MWLRLRQIALVAERLKPIEELFAQVLDLRACFRDPGVARFGLENALFAVGNQFIEVVAPIEENTAASRYLDRRGGDGGYMVITQCDSHPPRRKRVESLDIRIVHGFDVPGRYHGMQLHPRDTGGSFLEIDEQLGTRSRARDGPWMPAGTNWQLGPKSSLLTGIAAAEIQCDEPAAVAARWSEIIEIAPFGGTQIELDNAALRFVPCADERPEGLGGIDLACLDRQAIMERAQAHGCISGAHQVLICGTRMNFLQDATPA